MALQLVTQLPANAQRYAGPFPAGSVQWRSFQYGAAKWDGVGGYVGQDGNTYSFDSIVSNPLNHTDGNPSNNASLNGVFEGVPGTSFSGLVFYQGTGTMAGVWARVPTVQASGSPGGGWSGGPGGGGGGGGGVDRPQLVKQVLAVQPIFTRYSTKLTTIAASMASAAAIGDEQTALAFFGSATMRFLGAEQLLGDSGLAEVAEGGGGDVWDMLQVLNLGPAAQALVDAHDVATTDVAAAASEGDIGDAMATLARAWSAFGAQAAGPLASLTSGGSTLGLAVLLSRGGGAIDQSALMSAFLTGPAATAFVAACAVAAAAYDASTTLGGNQAAYAGFSTALVAFVTALGQAALLAGLL